MAGLFNEVWALAPSAGARYCLNTHPAHT
jgi:hypothetical protein